MDLVGEENRQMSASPDLGLSNDVRGDAVPEDRHSVDSRARSASAVAVMQDLDGLDELSDAWDALSVQSGAPTQDRAWIRAAASSFAAEGRLHIVVAGVPPNITAIAPLVKSRNGEARLELLGVHELYEPMD